MPAAIRIPPESQTVACIGLGQGIANSEPDTATAARTLATDLRPEVSAHGLTDLGELCVSVLEGLLPQGARTEASMSKHNRRIRRIQRLRGGGRIRRSFVVGQNIDRQAA